MVLARNDDDDVVKAERRPGCCEAKQCAVYLLVICCYVHRTSEHTVCRGPVDGSATSVGHKDVTGALFDMRDVSVN